MKKLNPVAIMLIISLLTFSISLWLPIPSLDVTDHPVFHKSDISGNEEIIFMSDTQEPVWVETFFLDENHNIEARDLVFKEIMKIKPSKIIHLGDIVSFGYKDEEWKAIDKYLYQLLEKNIEFYPTLGNHELFLFPEAGVQKFMERFPFYSKTGYSVNNGNTEIILLNSNFSDLTEKEIEIQQKWYEKKLKSLDSDSTITAVIVAAHHPPFTNSKIILYSVDVQKSFVPPFLQSQKAKVFISGHSHAFEHFKYKGKDFLVIGGGGGLQQPLYVGKEEQFIDQYSTTTTPRMFHFLDYKLENDTMHFTVKMLDETFSKFNNEYELKIPVVDR